MLQALSYKKGKKLLNKLNIPYDYKQKPKNTNLKISIIKNPPKNKTLPFIFPIIWI